MQKRKCQSPSIFPLSDPPCNGGPTHAAGHSFKESKERRFALLAVCVFPPFHGWLSVHPYTTHTLKWTDVSIWQRRPPPVQHAPFPEDPDRLPPIWWIRPNRPKVVGKFGSIERYRKIYIGQSILMGPFFLIFLSPLEQRWMHPAVHYICSVSVSTHPAFAAAPSWALPSPLLLLE